MNEDSKKNDQKKEEKIPKTLPSSDLYNKRGKGNNSKKDK